MTDADRWNQIKALFLDIVDLPFDEREAFLDKICVDDQDLRARVQALLDEDDAVEEGVLDQAVIPQDPQAAPPPDIDIDSMIGPYRLARLIGRGGMGNVYLAKRQDGGFEQTVALKVIRRGLDTDDLLSRFRYERQILASLDHPNIASLYDGGVTPDGRPFFVMEYVDGVPLTEHCDTNRLSMKHRLALFRTVCQAVQYAHQSLVVHRDLKPSNILVARDGTVKLLDFGIAKLLNDEGIDQTVPQTQLGIRLMTPEYAAPEQVRGDAITTATDVYQLGVLLYELLTGRRPYQVNKRVRWAIEQAILEEEPTRPSTVVRESATTEVEQAETISTARGIKPGELTRMLSGDLDTICLTALQKEPVRRYASVEQFSDDLRRHLAGIPVTARSDSALYRMGKFARRHQLAVTVSALALVLAVMGVTAYTVRIKAERDRTAQALRRSEQALDFLKNMILSGDPTEGDPDTPIGVVLDSAAVRVDATLMNEPEVARTVHAAIGQVYLSQGRSERADFHLRRAVELTTDETSERNIARNLMQLGTLRANQGDFYSAEEFNQQALQLLRGGEATESDLAAALDNYAAMLSNSGRDDEAVPIYEEALQYLRQQSNPDSAITLNNLAISYFNTGSLERAMVMQRRAVSAHRMNGDSPVRIGVALAVLASLYGNMGEQDSALVNHQRAVALLRETLGDKHLDTITARVSLALQLYRSSAFSEALAEVRPALNDAEESLGVGNPFTAYAQEVTGAILCDSNQPEEGAVLVRQSLTARSAFLPADHALLSNGSSLLGSCLFKSGRIREAEPLLIDGYEKLLTSQGPDSPMTQRARDRVRTLYQTTGRAEQADALGGNG